MPRIPSRPPVAPTVGQPRAPETGTSPEPMANPDAFEAKPKAVFEAYFTPYEPAQKAELAALDAVLEARAADSTNYAAGENPYRIDYAVYNLRSGAVIDRLIKAANTGVDVRVLIESDQIAPEREWNTVDEQFEEAGLKVIRSDKQVDLGSREAAHLIGIASNHLMHLKARVMNWKNPETGKAERLVLSGSMNPGDGASRNDENLNLIRDPRIAALYENKLDDVLAHRRTVNVWDDTKALNVLFTPAKSGPRPIEKLFEWIDAENEQILINVFDMKDIVDPASKKKLTERLIAAKNRGVDVVLVTDRKKSDGRDAQGNRVEMYGHFASNSWVDEDLERAGIPVYEFQNEAGQYNAVHGKAAVFGRSKTKVITGAGNWTRGAIGSGDKKARNEESFIFVDSHRLDGDRTGRRYMSNILHLLRHYDHQNSEHAPAKELIADLQSRPGWPVVKLDPARLLPAGFEGEARLSGAHPALGDGLTVRPGNDPAALRQPPLELPFGSRITYDVQDESGALVGDDLTLTVIPTGDAFEVPKGPS
jgi:phosphatidylserine/phosphatidylglycerophosphate/cardiolipin synthase-like enzyme